MSTKRGYSKGLVPTQRTPMMLSSLLSAPARTLPPSQGIARSGLESVESAVDALTGSGREAGALDLLAHTPE